MHSRRTAHSGTPATTPTPPPAPTPTLFPYTTLFRSGTYQWLASYAGDANNNGFTTSCGDSGEQLTVIKATPTITTSASPAASQVVGTTFTVSDTATFHNAFAPNGTLRYSSYYSDSPAGPHANPLPLHDALPIWHLPVARQLRRRRQQQRLHHELWRLG